MPLYTVKVFETFTTDRHASVEIDALSAEEAKGQVEAMYYAGELEDWTETERGAGTPSFSSEEITQEST